MAASSSNGMCHLILYVVLTDHLSENRKEPDYYTDLLFANSNTIILLTVYSYHLQCRWFVLGSFCGGALVQLQLKTTGTEWLLGLLLLAVAV